MSDFIISNKLHKDVDKFGEVYRNSSKAESLMEAVTSIFQGKVMIRICGF